MNPALAAIAAVTIGGGVLAVSARDVRATVLGLLVVLLAAPLIVDPWPEPLSILARIAATLLAVRLIAIGLRGEAATSGTRIGWPAELLLGAAGAVIGLGSHGLGAAGLGPAEAQAAGFALIVLAAAPLFTGRDVLRLAVGALLLLVGATTLRAGLDPSPSQGEQLVGAVLTIAIGGAIAVIATAARAAGGLEAIGAGRPGEAARRLPDAHRPAERDVRGAAPSRGPTGPSRAPAGPARGRREPSRSSAAPRRTGPPTGVALRPPHEPSAAPAQGPLPAESALPAGPAEPAGPAVAPERGPRSKEPGTPRRSARPSTGSTRRRPPPTPPSPPGAGEP